MQQPLLPQEGGLGVTSAMVADLRGAAREGNADCVPVVAEGVAGLPGMGGIWTWDTGVVGVKVRVGQ